MDLKELKEAAEKAGGDVWDLVPASDHHGPYVAGLAGDVCDFYTMSNPSLPSLRNGGESYPVPFAFADENAAFVALANPSAILSLISRVEALEEALKPSGETKAAYIGEFAFSVVVSDDDGEANYQNYTVPWTTIKEIMAAIRDRALSKITEA